MEGQVSRGQDKSTYGVWNLHDNLLEKRISSPTTNKDDQHEQIGFGHTRAHSAHSGNNKQSPALAISNRWSTISNDVIIKKEGDPELCDNNAGDGDGSDSRYSQGVPSNELEDDTALNTADATLTTADQSAALAGIRRLPTANEEIAQRLRASLQQLISDAARQGIDLSVTEGLMSPHELSAPSQQTARLRSAVVITNP
ncbi:hypothetical protein LWI29_009739 [Acer saccharum]|uniref:Uncharacterized protein n=1 Tax=Acer saccharum TaxID=4024 RepID=A0AA39VWX5_ACESA|nr:hypothetical protein LWI29_009739 [Acer saccharum]